MNVKLIEILTSIFWTIKLDENVCYISNLNINIREGNSILIKCPGEY